MNEDGNAAGRITVVRDRHLVPLLAAAQHAPREEQPWKGILLERHTVLPGELPQHEHPDLCLHLQTSGREDMEWWSHGRNAVEHTDPGSLILIAPGTSDRLRWKGRSERLILSVSQESLKELADAQGQATGPEFATNWAFHNPALGNVIAEMGRQAAQGFPLGRLYAGLLTLGFQTQLLRAHAATPIDPPVAKGGLSLPKLKRAMEYLSVNLTEDLRLEQVATELDMSRSHFAHEFRSSTGQTPYQYLLDQRIGRAKALLKTTALPVQHIAGLVGFESAVNFGRSFRQRVGTSPAAWRTNS